jgi:hypothetical protein
MVRNITDTFNNDNVKIEIDAFVAERPNVVQGAHSLISRMYKRFVERRRPIKSILRRKKGDSARKCTGREIRFRDLCKTSYPALIFFSKDSR